MVQMIPPISQPMAGGSTSPIMLATWSFGVAGCTDAWPALTAGGSALDAVCAAARRAELDPTVNSVGYGGLPDATGRMSLDACVMTGPANCGAVCAVAHHLHVADLARMVMERTSHVMLAGNGADAFADALGVAKSQLLSADAKDAWRRWCTGEPPLPSVDAGGDPREHQIPHDTIGVLAIDSQRHMAGACSTSGLPFKLAGRVGDSPIPGHGLYVDPAGGGAVATGNGELIMGVSGSFLAVECMRRGATPGEAVEEVLHRIDHAFHPRAHQQVAIIALAPDGRWAAGALRYGFVVAVADAAGIRTELPQCVLHPQKESLE
ncbi:MAG: hypothetical protein EXS15_02560 [Phycisphaerales bacterium]|nr:hypothetical protein [Phycisphaerales bacterium]